jgi:hypothetical protein
VTERPQASSTLRDRLPELDGAEPDDALVIYQQLSDALVEALDSDGSASAQ